MKVFLLELSLTSRASTSLWGNHCYLSVILAYAQEASYVPSVVGWSKLLQLHGLPLCFEGLDGFAAELVT